MKITRVVSKIMHSVRTRGLIATARMTLTYFHRGRRAPRGEGYDRRFGFDTAGNTPLWTLVDDPETVVGGHPYQPVDELDLEKALRFLEIDFSGFDFIDVGCGKGKALLIASRFGFRSLVGIELVGALVEVARRNLRRAGVENAMVHHCDARKFIFPNRPAVIFVFNPFGEEIMRTVVRHLLAANFSELYVLYCAPDYSIQIEFERINSFDGERSKQCLEVWKRVNARTGNITGQQPP